MGKSTDQSSPIPQSSYYRSVQSSPVRSVGSSLVTKRTSSTPKQPKSIVVVSQGPRGDSAESRSAARLNSLPPIVKPLIPLGQSSVNPAYPQLKPGPITEIGLSLESELRSAAELVATEQQKLVEKIRFVDQQITQQTSSITTEKQRRFNKATDNFAKLSEIEVLIARCESDIETLLDAFAKLNSALPVGLSLEPFPRVS